MFPETRSGAKGEVGVENPVGGVVRRRGRDELHRKA